ncbi:putative NET domain-containing protein [Helianthus annuus]|nr:putative NET domain-containing protein [Helianthus annuus]KAJ0847312.1 putative NET domain-containing protein [Helianthus annuus]
MRFMVWRISILGISKSYLDRFRRNWRRIDRLLMSFRLWINWMGALETIFSRLRDRRRLKPTRRVCLRKRYPVGLQSMPPEKMPQLLQITRKMNDQLAQEGDEIELDIEVLDTETLWELDWLVTNRKKHVSKTKRQALLVNNVSAVAPPSVSADIDDVRLSIVRKFRSHG